jgi:hypothetical protein
MKGRLGMPRGNPDARIVPIHCDDWARFTQSGEDLAHSFKALGNRLAGAARAGRADNHCTSSRWSLERTQHR